MTTLVIVESPGKVKKISALLGAGYKVAASVGHVRDLPRKEIGIAPPNFQLAYEPTERGRDVLARLKKEVAQAESVILATDPDREGEAIAWLGTPARIVLQTCFMGCVNGHLNTQRQKKYLPQ